MAKRALHSEFRCLFVPILLFRLATVSLADDYYPLHLGYVWLYEAKSEKDIDTQIIVLQALSEEGQGRLSKGVLPAGFCLSELKTRSNPEPRLACG